MRSARPRPAGVGQDRYGVILLLLVGLYFLLALTPGTRWAVSLGAPVGAAVMFLALRESGVARRHLRLAFAALVAMTAIAVVASIPALPVPEVLGTVLAGALVVTAPVAILRRIFTHEIVTIQTVSGAVCVYLLIGLFFAFALGAVDGATASDLLEPGADRAADYLYLSFITLTTVGFGDLTAATDTGRSILVLEALLGQIFLVTLVARLVGLFGQRRPVTEPDPPRPPRQEPRGPAE